MSDVKKLEQARKVQMHPENLGRRCGLVPWKKIKKFRVGCPVPAVAGKAVGWARWAMDLKNIKSIPSWAAQKFFFFWVMLSGFEPGIFRCEEQRIEPLDHRGLMSTRQKMVI